MVTLPAECGYGGTYDVNAISTTATFDVTATFAATGTGTAYWTSEEYGYRFARPTCTRVTAVTVAGVELPEWVREGSWILTNMEDTEVDMKIVHAFATLTVTNFPPHFAKVVAYKLAEHLAYKWSQSVALGQQILTELETIHLPRAIAMDARSEYVKEESHSWTQAGHETTSII